MALERKWSVMSEDTGEKLSRLNCARFFVISRGSKVEREKGGDRFVALSTNDSWKGNEREREGGERRLPLLPHVG